MPEYIEKEQAVKALGEIPENLPDKETEELYRRYKSAIEKITPSQVRKDLRAVRVVTETASHKYYFCGLCGNQVEEDGLYCKWCGAKFVVSKEKNKGAIKRKNP